jgi:hypothetical protein
MYISRTKQYHSRSNIYDQILKKNEQIYALIAICLSICPASVKHLDEAVQQVLREKYNDKMAKMASGDLGLYDELFAYACPKFITPCPPSFDGGDVIQEAFRLQLDLFLQEVSLSLSLHKGLYPPGCFIRGYTLSFNIPPVLGSRKGLYAVLQHTSRVGQSLAVACKAIGADDESP